MSAPQPVTLYAVQFSLWEIAQDSFLAGPLPRLQFGAPPRADTPLWCWPRSRLTTCAEHTPPLPPIPGRISARTLVHLTYCQKKNRSSGGHSTERLLRRCLPELAASYQAPPERRPRRLRLTRSPERLRPPAAQGTRPPCVRMARHEPGADIKASLDARNLVHFHRRLWSAPAAATALDDAASEAGLARRQGAGTGRLADLTLDDLYAGSLSPVSLRDFENFLAFE